MFIIYAIWTEPDSEIERRNNIDEKETTAGGEGRKEMGREEQAGEEEWV